MNWIKKWLNIDKERRIVIHDVNNEDHPSVEEILSEEQIERCVEWYERHSPHVNKLIKGVKMFHPSQFEDQNNPSIWKPEYWNWFLEHYILCPNCNSSDISNTRVEAYMCFGCGEHF